MEGVDNFLLDRLKDIKKTYLAFQNMQDYHVFTLLCLKYFYFSNIPGFDVESLQDCLTDGGKDGGIDAVFNDPNSEGNDVVIVQSKYYEKTNLTGDAIVAELSKINETIQAIDNCKVSDYSEKMVSAYRNAMGDKEDNGVVRIAFFTSYEPKNKREQSKLERMASKFFKNQNKEIILEMNFAKDIAAEIEVKENEKLFVDYDTLTLDRPGNALVYEDSAIVNISAQSLQNLQNRRRNGLLGMNLRYYVRQKAVDDGIQKTGSRDPENFWYKNNGIIILCDDYTIDGKVLKLYKFSIINGGQTTNRIGRLDIAKDFSFNAKW